MQMPILLWPILTGVLLLANCNSVPISDAQFCSPIPGDLGATCDNLLSKNQEILTQDQWVNRQAEWQAQGFSTECTTSKTIGDIKGEIEKLCSVTKCNYQVKQKILKGLSKIQALGSENKNKEKIE